MSAGRQYSYDASIKEQIRTLAAIKPKGHFLKICRKMFRADLVPRSNNATLKQRECRFHGVCVDVAIHIDFLSELMVLCFLPWIPASIIALG